MKLLRCCLLILLVVLLPLRGALAHGLPCVGGQASPAVEAATHAGHGEDQGQGHSQGHHAGHSDHADHADHGHQGAQALAFEGMSEPDSTRPDAGGSQCSACAVACACVLAVLPTAVLLPVVQTASPTYPFRESPASQFVAEGPERPPRSL